jgi:hypothetical protein
MINIWGGRNPATRAEFIRLINAALNSNSNNNFSRGGMGPNNFAAVRAMGRRA